MTRRAESSVLQDEAARRVLVVDLEGVERGGQPLDDVVVDLQGGAPAHPLLLGPGGVLLAVLLGQDPVRDVDAGAAHPHRGAGLVEQHLAVGGEVAELAVRPDDPLGHLVGLTGGQRLLVDRLDGLAVVGVQERQEALVARVERLRLVAVDPVELVRPPVRVGRHVPVVVAHVGQLLGVVDPELQVVELCLGLEAELHLVAPRWPQPVSAVSTLTHGVSLHLIRSVVPATPKSGHRRASARDVRDDPCLGTSRRPTLCCCAASSVDARRQPGRRSRSGSSTPGSAASPWLARSSTSCRTSRCATSATPPGSPTAPSRSARCASTPSSASTTSTPRASRRSSSRATPRARPCSATRGSGTTSRWSR